MADIHCEVLSSVGRGWVLLDSVGDPICGEAALQSPRDWVRLWRPLCQCFCSSSQHHGMPMLCCTRHRL